MSDKFNKIYDQSIKNPEKFWGDASEDIFWFKKPTKILNKSNPPFYKWFEDGVTNTCYNALDHHIEQGRGEKLSIIYDSPITGVQKKIRTLLLNQVNDGKGKRIRTDIDGAGVVLDLSTGNYNVIGSAALGKIGVTWNAPIKITSGLNKLSLTLANSSWSL